MSAMKLKLLLIALMCCVTLLTHAYTPVSVARQFCTAVYNNDMIKAKSLMSEEGARRTPNKMSFSKEEGDFYLQRLATAHYKIIEGVTASIVTVRFYDPQYEYLDKKGRWFCCSIGLVKVGGRWLVTDYGY